MRWTERQRAMLREMGIHLWAPEPAPGSVESDVVAAPAAPRRVEADPVAPPAVQARVEPSSAPRLPAVRHEASADRLPGLAAADWLIVAEPLDDADPQQRQLLDNMLRAIGIGLIAPDRERRAVFCALAAGTAGGGSPADSQAAVQAAIVTAAPRFILAFGKAAAATLLGEDVPLGSLRGRVHVHAGTPVVVTFALAFLLRHPAEKAKAWADLCLAVGALEGATAA